MCFTFTFAFLLHQSGLYPLLPAREVRLTLQLKRYLLRSMCPLRSYCGMVYITVHCCFPAPDIQPFPLPWVGKGNQTLSCPASPWLAKPLCYHQFSLGHRCSHTTSDNHKTLEKFGENGSSRGGSATSPIRHHCFRGQLYAPRPEPHISARWSDFPAVALGCCIQRLAFHLPAPSGRPCDRVLSIPPCYNSG